jgi:hypothetical protein
MATTMAICGYFHQEHPKYTPTPDCAGCAQGQCDDNVCLITDTDSPCEDYCQQEMMTATNAKPPLASWNGVPSYKNGGTAWCQQKCKNWTPSQISPIIGSNGVIWDVVERMGAINDLFFTETGGEPSPDARNVVNSMWADLKTYLDRNQVFNRLLWLKQQLGLMPVTYAPTGSPTYACLPSQRSCVLLAVWRAPRAQRRRRTLSRIGRCPVSAGVRLSSECGWSLYCSYTHAQLFVADAGAKGVLNQCGAADDGQSIVIQAL